MNSTVKMSPLSLKLGYWSALLSMSTFVLYTICFIGILAVSPLFLWTNVSDYLAYTKENPQFFKYLAQFAMILFAVCYLVLLNSIHEYAPVEKKPLTRLSLLFGSIFTALITVHYFVQLSIVNLNILKGNIAGLELYVQANPYSVMSAINMLGWTLFFGVSSLFVAPIFSGSRLEKVIRYAFLLNGFICILGGIGFVIDSVILVFLCINFGMGGTVTVFSIALYLFFKRLSKSTCCCNQTCNNC